MPVSGGGFEQSYNAQVGVDIETMLVITQHVTQACNDKREVLPTLQRIATLSAALGEVKTLIADNGFFSQANGSACHAVEIEPLLALTTRLCWSALQLTRRHRRRATRSS